MKLSEARILVVDDEPLLRDLFISWLRAAGCHHVRAANDGKGALAVIRSEPVDLLITDLRMPVMNGTILVQHLADMPAPIPCIIVISGFGDIAPQEMYALGVETFLSKPFRREELIEQVEKSLSEPATLWSKSMELTPTQSMMIKIQAGAGSEESSSFRMGRGGFCARYPEPLALSKVAFRCSVAAIQLEISGQGYVRWYSKTDQAAGVEFAFLDASCRSWVAESIITNKPRAFIPSFADIAGLTQPPYFIPAR